MVKRYFDTELKGKFEGVHKFLYEVVNQYKTFLDQNNISYTTSDLQRCVDFLKKGILDRCNAQQNLNLILRFENGDSILSTEIAKGPGRDDAVLLYLNGNHIDDLYPSQVSECEDCEEKGDFEDVIDDKWVRFLYIPVNQISEAPNEQMPGVSEERPIRELHEILADLERLKPKN